jgi:predicted MFS family arabinose efflux permease
MIAGVRDRNIWIVNGAALILGIAYGVSIALTSLHLDARGFSKESIGSLAAWFALGIVLLSLPMGAILRVLSARVSLILALLGYAASVTAFPWLESYAAIAVARLLDGMFSVAIWVSFETILLFRSDPDHKANVTSLYAMSIAVGYVLGPIAAKFIVMFAPTRVAFGVSGALSIAAALLVAARLDRDVAREPGSVARGESERGKGEPAKAQEEARTPALALLSRIKTSCFATFAYGYFQSSVVLFLPLYLMEEKGIARDQTIVIPAFFAAGMLLFSNRAGRIGDRVGHLAVMRVLASIGLAMIAGFVILASYASMCVAVFVAGATLASISPVSLALQGLVTRPRDYARSNAIYNAFYAAGMLLGPPISSVLFARLGGVAMLLHLAALWGAFIVFARVFAADDPAYRSSAARRGASPWPAGGDREAL